MAVPESDSVIGQHLLESNQCARDSWLQILTTARSRFCLSTPKAVYFRKKKKKKKLQQQKKNETDLCWPK